MNSSLLRHLKFEAKIVLKNNTRFHDYGHALEVLENVRRLLKKEGKEKYDQDIVFTAALFHDTSNKQNSPKEGIEGAEIAEKILLKIKEFPKEKIKEVKRLIISHSIYGKKRADEILFEAADQMAAFSNLGLLRSFMMFGKANKKVDDAIKEELNYLKKRFNKFRLNSAKQIVKSDYFEKRKMLKRILLNSE